MSDTRVLTFDTSNPNAPGNDFFCVTLAGWAYLSESQLKRQLSESNYRGPDTVVVKNALTSCFVIRWGDVTAVAFRGSATWREWLNNLNVWLEPVEHGRVHAGFWRTIKRIGPRLFLQIVPDLLAGQKIVLTGHSRGGSLAYLFAYYLLRRGHRPNCVVTFGAPKFCDQKFACHWQGVPYKPDPHSSDSSFWHWLFGIKPIFVVVTLYSTLRYLYPHLRAETWRWFMHLAVIDHSIALYRSAQTLIQRKLKTNLPPRRPPL